MNEFVSFKNQQSQSHKVVGYSNFSQVKSRLHLLAPDGQVSHGDRSLSERC